MYNLREIRIEDILNYKTLEDIFAAEITDNMSVPKSMISQNWNLKEDKEPEFIEKDEMRI